MYTNINFKSKADLKRAVADGDLVRCHSPGPFPCPDNGRITLEGPHYPKPHRWYASALLVNGVIMEVS